MTTYIAPAKVNVFLKITGRRGMYHEILSRFIRVPQLFDTLRWVEKEEPGFIIEGDFACRTEHNTIYKAYKALSEATGAHRLETLFRSYGVAVDKRIPAFAGLGGGSSDAATFLQMCNEEAELRLSVDALAHIGAKVGADVPFFVYGYASANVSGIGEVVEPFDETPPKVEIFTPRIEISTPAVYREFRAAFYRELDPERFKAFASADSRTLLATIDAEEANDLFVPALALYPELTRFRRPGWFFSGSGSSFFRLVAE